MSGGPVRAAVDVWWLDLDADLDAVEACRALLGPGDAARVASLATEELRRRMTVRLGRRRAVLADALGVAPDRLELRREPSGRPFALAPGGARVSVSASSRGGVGVVACSRGATVGVDVEASSELGSAPRLVEWIASVTELEQLEALDAADRRAAVLRLWTRKEALLKATGEGIGAGLVQRTVPLDELSDPVAFQPDSGGAWWHCHDLACPNDALAAALVVSTGSPGEPPAAVRISTR